MYYFFYYLCSEYEIAMKRKVFIRNVLLALPALGALGKSTQVFSSNRENKTLKNVGFEHLPKKGDQNMNAVLHKADSRGHANHGWLNTYHSFSFANYYNPDRMNFGVLRVLNDDYIAPGMGFPTHPHNNMEIITIPFEGDLEHKDSMGNSSIIKEGDIQVMSAGTGVQHSEFNPNKDKAVKLFQIWLFPREQGVKPRYDQMSLSSVEKRNQLYQVLSPNQDDDGVWIHQDAWFHIGKFDKDTQEEYTLRKPETNGVYIIVTHGALQIEDQQLNQRDAIGLWDATSIRLKATEENTEFLVMEIPLHLPKM